MDFSDIDFRAVVLGFLFNIGASILIGIITGVIFFSLGISPDQSEAFMHTGMMLIIGLIVGLLCVMGGGFIAGHIADYGALLNGAMAGVAFIPIGFLFLMDYPLWYRLAALVGVIPFGMLGGYIAERRGGVRRSRLGP